MGGLARKIATSIIGGGRGKGRSSRKGGIGGMVSKLMSKRKSLGGMRTRAQQKAGLAIKPSKRAPQEPVQLGGVRPSAHAPVQNNKAQAHAMNSARAAQGKRLTPKKGSGGHNQLGTF